MLAGRAGLRIDRRMLADYDLRILGYETLLAKNRRAEPFRTFKYFQYLALLHSEVFLDPLTADPKAFRHKWLTLACGLSGADCLAQEDMERMLVWLDHALESTAKEKPSTFRTFLHLLRGLTLDVLGRRDAAAAVRRS